MANIKNIYKSEYDGFITVIWGKSISQYEGRALCPNIIKAKIDKGEYTSLKCFRREVPLS